MSKAPILASKINLNFMFFWNRSWTSFFLFFSSMMPENVILRPPSKSTGAQNGAKNQPSGAKRQPKSIRWCLPRAVPEATGDTEAAQSDQGTDLRPRHRFSNILLHFRSINVTFVWEAKFANRGYILYVAFWIVVCSILPFCILPLQMHFAFESASFQIN